MDLRGRRAAQAVLLAATLALAVVWARGPASVPLYDGACVGNPYQYLNPPAGAPTTPPTSGKHSVSVQGGTVPGTIVQTGEFPAQAQLSSDDGSIIPPAGATQVTLTIDPVPPPAVLPADGGIDGNVYRMAATGNTGGAARVDATKPLTVTLRTTQISGALETVEEFDGSNWTQLQTQPPGTCAFFYTATATTLGDFALVKTAATPTAAASPPPATCTGDTCSGTGTGVGAAIAIVIAVIVLAGAAAVISRRRAAQRRSARGRRRWP